MFLIEIICELIFTFIILILTLNFFSLNVVIRIYFFRIFYNINLLACLNILLLILNLRFLNDRNLLLNMLGIADAIITTVTLFILKVWVRVRVGYYLSLSLFMLFHLYCIGEIIIIIFGLLKIFLKLLYKLGFVLHYDILFSLLRFCNDLEFFNLSFHFGLY